MFVRQMDSFFRNSAVKENLQTNVIKRKWPQVTTVSHKDRSADKLLNIFHVRLLFTCLIIRNCFHRLKKSFPNSLYPCLFFRLRKNNTFYDCRLLIWDQFMRTNYFYWEAFLLWVNDRMVEIISEKLLKWSLHGDQAQNWCIYV